MSGIIYIIFHLLTKYKDELTEKPRMSMEWLPENCLKLAVKHGVTINMTYYPGGKLIEPKHTHVDHICHVLTGWKEGQIKWVKLTADEVEKMCEELSVLTSITLCNSATATPVL